MDPLYGLDRRGFLRVGTASVVGCTLPKTLVRAASDGGDSPGKAQAKSMLLVLLSGGPSQLDTLDPKPAAPVSVAVAA